MDRINDYVEIMIKSLEKKSIILDRLIKKNELQRETIAGKSFDEIDWDRFNIIVTEKEAEIDHINEMDEGFQALYDRIGEILKEEKEAYAQEIKHMQKLIAVLEEKSIKIRTGEERNRTLIEQVISGRKKEIKQARTSLKAASSYYQNMSKLLDIGPTSVDKKK